MEKTAFHSNLGSNMAGFAVEDSYTTKFDFKTVKKHTSSPPCFTDDSTEKRQSNR